MPTTFQKAKRRLRTGSNTWSDPISYATSSESVEMTNGTDLQTKMNSVDTAISNHTSNTSNPHNVTKSQIGLEKVENKSSATIRGELTKSNVITALGYTPYTPTEVDNKFSQFETNIDWKEAVATYNDIATTYPNPQDGWTVNVNDTDYTYRYNGTAWVAISANAIPNATTSVNGLMTTTQVSALNSNTSARHSHSNKTILDNTTASYTTGDQTKLSGIATGAEVNQNAFSNVKVGSTTIAADTKTDTLEVVAGNNINVTPDATNDKITISSDATKTEITPVLTSGTPIATLTIDGTPTDLYVESIGLTNVGGLLCVTYTA